MLITLLLAVLTIGAVSAAEDADMLAAEDAGDEAIAEAPGEDIVSASDEEDALEAVEIDDELEEVNPEDFNVWVSNKTLDADNDKDEVVITFTSPQDADGEFKIFVNGIYQEYWTLSNETVGQTFNLTLADLSISQYGALPVSFDYDYTTYQCGTLNVVKNYSPDEFDTTTFDSITLETYRLYSLTKVPAYGTLIVYVDGKLIYSKYIDPKNPYLQLYVGDLNITENGKYNIRTEYNISDSGQLIDLDDFNVSVTCMPVDIFVSGLDIDVADEFDIHNLGYVSDENGITGTIVGYINDVTVFNKTYSAGDDAYFVSLNDFTYYDGFTLGNHTVRIVYLKNNGKKYSKEGFILFYADPTIDNPYTIDEGEEKYITVNYYKGSTGNLVVYNTEKDSTAPAGWKKGTVFMTETLNGNGSAKIPLKTLDVGYHGFCLNITLGSYSVEKYIDVNVNEKQDLRTRIKFVPAVSDSTYGEDAAVTVTAYNGNGGLNESFSGNVLVEIKDIGNVIVNKSNVFLTNGVGSVTFSNLNAGNYTVSLSANDTEEYKFSSESATFTVNKAASALDIDAVIELDAGTPLNITVKTVNATGISAKIDDGDAAVDGNVIMIPALSIGTYTLKVTTIVDDNHLEATRNVTLNVTMPKSSIVMDKNIVIIKGSSANVTVNTTNALGFNATIDGHPDAVSINGNVITISGLGLGTYVLSVTTIVDENHISVTENANVTVKNLDSSIEFTKSSMAFDYGSSDSIGVIVSNGKIGKVVIIGHDEAAINITDNVITVSNLSAGSYVLCVTTDPDENYDAVNGTVPVTVNRVASSLNVSDIAFDYGASGSTTVDFADALGFNASVAGHPGAVAIDGNKITVSGLDAGTYVLSVATIVDANHIAAVKNVTVTVNKLATSIASSAVSAVYKDSKYLVATLKDAQGKAVAGAEISTNIKGLNKMTTDSNGQVKWLVGSLTPKNYDVVLTFAGNANYVKSTQKVAVKVAKATPKMTAKAKTFKKSVKTKKYSVTLKDNKGKAIKKAKLTLKVKGKTYKATTNAKGVATFKITKLTKKGKHKATVKYAGSAYYKGITKKYTVKVK